MSAPAHGLVAPRAAERVVILTPADAYTPKWRCGPVAYPVIPEYPRPWPLFTACQLETEIEERCA